MLDFHSGTEAADGCGGEMNSNEEGNSEKKSLPILLVAPAIIALIPVVAYLLGISFYRGYLSTFGVDSDIFPISTQHVYLKAYHAVTFILLNLVANLVSIVELIKQINCHVVIILMFPICIMTGSLWYLKRKDKNPEFKSIALIFIVLFSYPFLLYGLLFISISWWSPSFAAYSAGQQIAEEQIDNFTKNDCSPDQRLGTDSVKIDTCSIIQDKNGKILHEGLLIAINDKDIAMFKKDGSYIFTRQKDWLIRRKLHKNL